jgi:hypothetical protein
MNGLIASGPEDVCTLSTISMFSMSSVVVVIVHSEDCDLLTGWGRTGMTLSSGDFTLLGETCIEQSSLCVIVTNCTVSVF